MRSVVSYLGNRFHRYVLVGMETYRFIFNLGNNKQMATNVWNPKSQAQPDWQKYPKHFTCGALCWFRFDSKDELFLGCAASSAILNLGMSEFGLPFSFLTAVSLDGTMSLYSTGVGLLRRGFTPESILPSLLMKISAYSTASSFSVSFFDMLAGFWICEYRGDDLLSSVTLELSVRFLTWTRTVSPFLHDSWSDSTLGMPSNVWNTPTSGNDKGVTCTFFCRKRNSMLNVVKQFNLCI